jgi:ABC-type Na+ transport system ATPase subunit NatA
VVGLRKVFGEHVAVKHADLTVMPGSFYGLVGPNGAGKTTTLSMAVGLLRPDAGRSLVFGTDVWQDPLHAKTLMGVLPDGLAMPLQLTGRELLGYLRRLRGLEPATTSERADELLSVLELTGESERTLIIDYSSGMRKKIGLATALLHGPRLLVPRRAVRGGRPGLGGGRQADPHALGRGRRLGAALEPRHGAGRAALRHGRRHGAGRGGGGGRAGRAAREPDA